MSNITIKSLVLNPKLLKIIVPMEEKELIEKAQSGDKQSLAELVKKYEQTIYNFAFKICRDKNYAEQIMQETFYSMVKSLHQFGPCSPLFKLLLPDGGPLDIRHFHAWLPKSRSFVSFDDEENLFEEKYAADWNSIPYKDAENEELKNILDESIQNLSPDYRLVFLLRDVEGLSTEETAQVTELSIPAVKSRLHRARAFLRKEINEAFSR